MNKLEAEQVFASNDIKRICNALVAVSFYESDWQWAQNKCLHFLESENPTLSGLAVSCLGHIARINGTIDKEKVVEQLNPKQSDPAIAGQISDALEDIALFIK